ncbi:MAG: hydrolase TatD [Woeseiaceae bacterium]|nr:hydrolase TatD [Woeseiaceae bacterium]
MPYELIDIGANLTHRGFDEDRAEMMQRADDAGVTRMIVTGSSNQGSLDAVDLAETEPGRLYATAGVHPHHAADFDDSSADLIRELAAKDCVVAVGECGLDYFRDFSPRQAQLAAFQSQLDIAAETAMPIFLHQRDAHDDFVDVLEPMLPRITRAVAHCFTGEHESLREYLAMGLWIGITGWICDERRGAHLHDIVSAIPDDRLLIETDAPYLLPRTIQPKPKTRRNEPAYLQEVLRVVAEARGQTEEHVARITTENAIRFFGL